MFGSWGAEHFVANCDSLGKDLSVVVESNAVDGCVDRADDVKDFSKSLLAVVEEQN